MRKYLSGEDYRTAMGHRGRGGLVGELRGAPYLVIEGDATVIKRYPRVRFFPLLLLLACKVQVATQRPVSPPTDKLESSDRWI